MTARDGRDSRTVRTVAVTDALPGAGRFTVNAQEKL
jgi:hypothetical protein